MLPPEFSVKAMFQHLRQLLNRSRGGDNPWPDATREIQTLYFC
jgi:hypothetical protein